MDNKESNKINLFIPQLWEDGMRKALETNKLIENYYPKFVPKYKGRIKLLKWMCVKLNIGEYVYPKFKEGKKIKIKSLNEADLND